jgi:MtfA peptidase
MIPLLRRWRRARLIARPLAEAARTALETRLPFWPALSVGEQQALVERLKIFVAEKHFTGAGGLAVSDEMRIIIAALAVRLILHLDLSYYDDLSEIIVYPHTFKDPEDGEELLGETLDFGVVVLSWPLIEAYLAAPQRAIDVATHEFAHILDQHGGAFDGTPRLRQAGDYRRWAEVMERHFRQLSRGRGKAAQLIDDYGAEDEAEFFAVASEVFFNQGEELRELVPDLHEELRRFYGYAVAPPPRKRRARRAPKSRRR